GQVGGGYFVMGGTVKDVLYLAEGYATAATIHEATGATVVIGFTAGNLLLVAKMMREKSQDTEIVICADDDYRTTGNPGVTKARAAAEQIGGKVAIPEFGENRLEKATDFNDMAAHLGLERVRECLKRAAAPSADEIEAPRPLMREVPPADPFPVDAL